MTIRHLKIFTAVCSCGSITGAAEKLYMTQPAVSLAIKELEENYGVKLFDRLTRRIQITSDGKRMLDYAIHVVSLFDEMEQAMRNPDAVGQIRIGGSLTIGSCLLPGYVQKLEERFPHLQPLVTVDNTDRIINAVRSGRLDIGFVEGVVNDDSMVAQPFMEDHLIAVCGQNHAFANGAPVTLEAFLAQPLFLRERGSGTRELFQSAVTVLGYCFTPAWESVSTTALIHAVAKGGGVSVLPEKLVMDALQAGKLHRVNLQTLPLSRQLYLIYHKNKYLSAGLQALIAITMEGSAKLESFL
ncbi:MAG: LysR family transcriptional regulator [Eubacteriales bacterium]|nr:LysR family transcriptional regulator [Eubacteriales bacterium]